MVETTEEYCLMKIKLIDDCIKRTHDPEAIRVYNDYKKIFLDKITNLKEKEKSSKKVQLIKLKKEQEELLKKLNHK